MKTHTTPLTILTFMFCLSFLVHCMGYKDVRPGVNNHHSVITHGETKEKASRKAIKQATSYCKKEHQKKPVFLNEKQEYDGNMDEDAYNAAKTVSKVASVLGLGNIGQTGSAADSALGEGYKADMQFKCQ